MFFWRMIRMEMELVEQADEKERLIRKLKDVE